MKSVTRLHLYCVQMRDGSMEDTVPVVQSPYSYLYAVQTKPKTRSMNALHPTRYPHLYRVQTGEGASS